NDVIDIYNANVTEFLITRFTKHRKDQLDDVDRTVDIGNTLTTITC
ncbi:Tkp1 protein, partial [Vanderwaltozyma polyspora DSM 70294]